MSTVKFNGIDLPSFVKLVGREISVLPYLNVRYTELPRQIGSSFLYTQQGVKKESLDFLLIPENLFNVDEAVIDFSEWLRGNEFKPSRIEFSDKPDRHSFAQVNGSVTVSDLFTHGSLSVEFLYVDPLSYLNTEINQTGASPLQVNYSGDVAQYPVIQFTLSSVATRVTLTNNLVTGKKVELRGNFPTGTVIQVNMNTKKITVNSQVNMSVLTLDSEWLPLVKGNNRITLQINGSNSTQQITVKSKVAVY